MTGVCFFGGYDPDYPRNRVIKRGLEELGVDVVECVANRKLKVIRRYHSLWNSFKQLDYDSFDVVFVPEFRHKDMPLARWLARRTNKPVIFDPLVSRYDTRVHDRADAREGTLQAWHNRNLDRMAMRLADLVLADTPEHEEYFAQFVSSQQRMAVLPVGYDESVFNASSTFGGGGSKSVLFYGSFLPLHGIETIVDAAIALQHRRDIRWVIVGGGQTHNLAVDRLRKAAADNVELHPWESESRIVERLHASAVTLGIFGTTDKAARVVPNKVFQCLGAGTALITADTPPIRRWFVDGEHLRTVPPGDANALAATVAELIDDPQQRQRLARNGHELSRSLYSPRPIAQQFSTLAEALL